MPQIIVTADKQTEGEPAIMFRERVSARDFESEHFARHLAQRLGWAVADAHAVDEELGPEAETGFADALSPVVQQAW